MMSKTLIVVVVGAVIGLFGIIALTGLSVYQERVQKPALQYNVDDAVPNFSPECVRIINVQRDRVYDCTSRLDDCEALRDEVLRSYLAAPPAPVYPESTSTP